MPVPEGGFTVLRFDRDPAVAWTECAARGTRYEEPGELDRFEVVFGQLRAQALDQRGSLLR